MMNNGRWVKVAADLENLTLRLDNRALAGSTRSRSSEVYNKEMQIHRGTKVERAPQPSRPFVLAVSKATTWKRQAFALVQAIWITILAVIAIFACDIVIVTRGGGGGGGGG